MKITREIQLPVSKDVARQRLASALATPYLIQKGTLLQPKITLTGTLEGDTIHLVYTRIGGRYSRISMTGQFVDEPAGPRLILTVPNKPRSFLHYLPLLLWVIFLIIPKRQPDPTLFAIGKFVIGVAVSIFLSRLYLGARRYEQTSALTSVRDILNRIVTSSAIKH